VLGAQIFVGINRVILIAVQQAHQSMSRDKLQVLEVLWEARLELNRGMNSSVPARALKPPAVDMIMPQYLVVPLELHRKRNSAVPVMALELLVVDKLKSQYAVALSNAGLRQP